MHKLLFPFIATTLALVACSQSNQNDKANQTATQAAMPTSVSGTVSLRVPAQLSATAQLKLALTNVSQKPPVTIAETNTTLGALPAPFQIDFDPAKIDPNAFYILDAKIVDGERHYLAPRQYPVVTKGAPARVDVQLTSEPTAAEKLEAEHALLKAAIGGMKRVQGASEDDNSTTAWDAFFDKNGLRYIREIADYGDKGRINMYYAYRDGKPMMVIKENVPALAERPNAVTKAGWDDQGALVLHTRKEFGTLDALPEAEAQTLKERSVYHYDTISKRKP